MNKCNLSPHEMQEPPGQAAASNGNAGEGLTYTPSIPRNAQPVNTSPTLDALLGDLESFALVASRRAARAGLPALAAKHAHIGRWLASWRWERQP